MTKTRTTNPASRAKRVATSKGTAKQSGPRTSTKKRSRRTSQGGAADQADRVAAGGKTSKKQICIDLLHRPKGASVDDLRKATGWQAHSVRGFLSGTVKKMPGWVLVVDKPDDGDRRFRVVDAAKTS